MVSAKHGKQVITQGIHGPISFEYADDNARNAAVGFDIADKYKLAVQLNDGSVWMLTDPDPGNITWQNIIGELNINISAGTTNQNLSNIYFGDANGLAFGLSGSTITGSYTVPTQTNQTIGYFAAGNTTNNSSGTFDARSVTFNGAGNVSVGYTNGSVVISGVGGGGNVNFSAGTTSNNLSNIVFSNQNGVSFGLNGSTLTASVPVQSVQTQSIVYPSAGTQIAQSGIVSFANSNGISFGMSNSNQITASYTVPSTVGLISGVNVSAGTTSNDLSALTFSNSNGFSFGLNGSVITGSQRLLQMNVGASDYNVSYLNFVNLNNVIFGRQTIFNSNGLQISASAYVGVTAGTTNSNLSQLSFSNVNGVSFGLNGNTITASCANGAVNFSAGTTSNNLTNFVFSNSNGLSFGLNGSTLTAVMSQELLAFGNTTNQSNSTINASRMLAYGAGAVSVGASVGGIVISAPVQTVQTQSNIQQISAGTQVASTGLVVFNNSNNISFGMNNNTLTASFSYTQSGGTLSALGNISNIYSNNATQLDQFPIFFPLDVQTNYSFSNCNLFLSNTCSVSSNSSYAFQLAARLGIYSINGTSLSLLSSGSVGTTITMTGTVSSQFINGFKNIVVPINVNMPAGNYVVGLLSNSNLTGPSWITMSNVVLASSMPVFSGQFGSTVNQSNCLRPGFGIFSTTASNLATSYALADLRGTAASQHFQPIFDFRNY